jgi:RNA polymerase sigma factor (sigma-70 family)
MTNLLLPREIGSLVTSATHSSDAELLRRYCDKGDSEAFEGIVRRHARTVLGVCQRILQERHAAEDAFQATFLQLVRKARTLHSPAALAGWLYRTARRTSLRHRRQSLSSPIVDQSDRSQSPLDLLSARELLTAIEEEIARLPEKYQLPLIFCYFDGLSKGEAAERLGLSVDVFRGRLDRGREKLRLALIRRGFAPTAAFGLLVPVGGPAVAELLRRTVGMCTRGEPTPTAIAVLAADRPSYLMNAGLLAGVLLLGGLALIAATGRTEPQNKHEQSQVTSAQSRQDLYGDPLPPDAIARMGSTRWRHVDDSRTYFDVIPSPTGKLVATVSRGENGKGLVRVWDVSDGRQVCSFPWDDTVVTWNMQFTPDGSRLMILTTRGLVRFHDPRTGKLLAESKPVSEKANEGMAHALTSDGRWVVSNRGYRDNPKLILSEISADPAGKRHQVNLDPPPGKFDFYFAEFNSDGKTLLSSTYDGVTWKPIILHWDIQTGKLSRQIPLAIDDMAMRFSRDGKRLSTERPAGPVPDSLHIWDTATGTQIVKLEGAERGFGMHLSPDGNRIVSGNSEKRGDEKVVRATVWELERGKVIARVKLPEWCYCFYLLPDGKTLLASSFSGMMFGTWDIATGRRLSQATGHESSLRHLEFTRDGKSLLTVSDNPEEWIGVWETMTGKNVRELAAKNGHQRIFLRSSCSFVLTPGGAVVTSGDGVLVWTDLKTGRELRRIALEPIAMKREEGYDIFHEEKLSLTLDPQTGKPAVFGLHTFGPIPELSCPKHGWTSVVTLWDAESGELLAKRAYPLSGFYQTGVVSPDGRLLARDAYDSSTHVVVIESAFSSRDSFKLKQPSAILCDYLFSPDGQTLIAETRKRPSENSVSPVETSTIHLWEVRSGKQRLEFTLPLAPSPLAISHDGHFLAGARPDNKSIHVWDLATGNEVAVRSGYSTLVTTLTFRPDDKALATGHADGTALVWDLSGLPGVKSAVADREAAWKDLASTDAGKAYLAILSLAADPGCVGFLRGRLKPVPKIPEGEIQKLVKDLGNDEFATREAATKTLTKLGDAADVELQTLLRGGISPEQQQRIEEVLAKRGLIESEPDRLRSLRCVEVLERVDSVDARKLLGELAKGAVGARLTREAAVAVRRLRDR